MLTFEEALDALGLEPEYVDATITRVVTQKMAAAHDTLRGAVGYDVDERMPDDPRVKELEGIYLDDLYSNRGLSAKVTVATRALVYTMEAQLRLELRRMREAASV